MEIAERDPYYPFHHASISPFHHNLLKKKRQIENKKRTEQSMIEQLFFFTFLVSFNEMIERWACLASEVSFGQQVCFKVFTFRQFNLNILYVKWQ